MRPSTDENPRHAKGVHAKGVQSADNFFMRSPCHPGGFTKKAEYAIVIIASVCNFENS
jgi:hypothetical protein